MKRQWTHLPVASFPLQHVWELLNRTNRLLPHRPSVVSLTHKFSVLFLLLKPWLVCTWLAPSLSLASYSDITSLVKSSLLTLWEVPPTWPSLFPYFLYFSSQQFSLYGQFIFLFLYNTSIALLPKCNLHKCGDFILLFAAVAPSSITIPGTLYPVNFFVNGWIRLVGVHQGSCGYVKMGNKVSRLCPQLGRPCFWALQFQLT